MLDPNPSGAGLFSDADEPAFFLLAATDPVRNPSTFIHQQNVVVLGSRKTGLCRQPVALVRHGQVASFVFLGTKGRQR
ncbi:hypothetical protein ZHAS_00015648 [Anopheles sinensis]|uniref:Uncharacterized protein n=1 Tax=Anopheles sinensis TaxID=74873 RepID=A0A084WAT6_ANOSI|nr:hypothetical protein ZHAS_00015648 [Anopheles sinensis]